MNIALQLWSVRDHTGRDMLRTLHGVARLGYRAVEFADFNTATVADIRRTLDELDLGLISAHTPLADLAEHHADVIARMDTLGCRE